MSCSPIRMKAWIHSFTLIREAASDPDVMTIKITIYRLAKKARLVEYLCAAAEKRQGSDSAHRAEGAL